MPDSFIQAIHKYAMDSDDNLIVFVRAALSFNELRKMLISDFSKKLAEKLKQKFPESGGWEIDAQWLINDPLRRYSWLSIRHESWQKNLNARIETDRSCRDVCYGVQWDSEQADPAVSNNIFEIMKEENRPGAKAKNWPWWIWANRFRDWFQEDALTSMRQVIRGESPAEILDFFYNELVAIVENIDSYLKSHRS